VKRFIRSGRAELCVEDSQTAGPVIVCLHAGVCDRRMWAPQVEALQATHRVIAYDRRGFGETRCAPEPFSHVDDLMAVLDALQIDAAVLMGCSQGGRFALDAALAFPARVQALVLVACAVTGAPEPESGFSLRVQARIDACDAAEQRGDLAAVNELEAQLWLDGPEQPTGRVSGPLRELFLSMNGVALAAPPVGDAVASPSAWSRLEQLRLPVLIAWGTLDFEHLDTRMRALARRIDGAQTFVMDGVAHLPGLEQPAPFNTAVGQFLASLGHLSTSPARPTGRTPHRC
jgi:pimeloyl-ACP methyl ester carboxylesterase